jgi:hypothetical protein
MTKDPKQKSFRANTSAWRFVTGWNLKRVDVCGMAIVSPVLAPQSLVRLRGYNEMIGRLFPGQAACDEFFSSARKPQPLDLPGKRLSVLGRHQVVRRSFLVRRGYLKILFGVKGHPLQHEPQRVNHKNPSAHIVNASRERHGWKFPATPQRPQPKAQQRTLVFR